MSAQLCACVVGRKRAVMPVNKLQPQRRGSGMEEPEECGNASGNWARGTALGLGGCVVSLLSLSAMPEGLKRSSMEGL